MWITCLACFIVSCFVNWLWYRGKNRPIVYRMESDKWIFIEDKPFPQDFEGPFLVTDGISVDWQYTPKYDHLGRLTMNYYRAKSVIAYMPFPQPPALREFQCQNHVPSKV